MKYFEHTRAESFEEAGALVDGTSSVVMAGGTDLLAILKDEIISSYPNMVVDIKGIAGANATSAEEADGTLRIGALAKLWEVELSQAVRDTAPILCEAAKSVATPLIRRLGTVGGNICQDVRCWYYRYPHEAGGRMNCARKGGDTCYALQGDNRYHSIFGGMKASVTPCTRGCPAATDIPAYMEQLRKGSVKAAADIILSVNPMPMITSRVCAHFCQEECNRCANDESVSIGSVERFVGDYILAHAADFYQPPKELTGKSVAVVGGGPSGLAAAYYLRKSGHDVTVYDSKEEPGGMLMYAIPAYRLPKDIVRAFTLALESMGIKFSASTTVGRDITAAALEKKHDSVFYATGAWKRPIIGIAGEELTEFGLDFLIEVNKWMEGKIGSKVLVTGGGNVAMDVAITAKRLGARHVTLACLESEAEMPAGKEEIARAREEGIEILPSWGLSRVLIDGGAVSGMKLKRCTQVRDASGAFSPQYDENEKITVEAENVLMAVGQLVDLSFLDEKYAMQLNRRGLIDVSDETQATSRQGVFAGGDVTTGPATVIQGIANGRKASIGMNVFLGTPGTPCCGAKDNLMQPFLTFVPGVADRRVGAKLHELPPAERDISKEDSFGLNEREAMDEAARCLNCGCYSVHPSDLAPALVALGARVVTNRRTVEAEDFFCTKLRASDFLDKGEIVQEVRVPKLEGAIMHYDKFRLRDSVDFAILSLATVFAMDRSGRIAQARVVFGGVAPSPVRAVRVEQYLIGKEVSGEVAEKAGELAVQGTLEMAKNRYKVVELREMVRAAILRLKAA
ncbi:MAG: FAD-dependent oxidoreductase [Synergistaceae bacterium]|jgi:NADPH-dependent glutamate synthase beta subunit-like oxidoreductase|nr:FAD-dependent oxidoreductase [Synergistaceae bacterium]